MLGFTQVIGEGASTGPVMTGFLTTSLSSIGLISSRLLSSNPPPTFPTCTKFPVSSYIAMTSEPKVAFLIPSPWVQPTTIASNVCDGVRAASSFDSLRILYAKAVLQLAKVGRAFLAENNNFSIYDRPFRFDFFRDGLNFWIGGCHVAEISVLKFEFSVL